MKLRVKEYIVLVVAVSSVVAAFVFAFNGSAATPDGETGAGPVVAKVAVPDVPAVPVLPEEILTALEDSSIEDVVLDSGNDFVPGVPVPARKPVKPPRPAMKNFSCAGQICIDAETGNVLSSRNANVPHPPASVTKLMTIFVVFDAVKSGKVGLSDSVKASLRAQNMGGTQVHLAAGEVNSVDDLLYALMLQSANDAAVALAEKVSGSVEAFVDEMNAKARELGLAQTKFSSPHGLPVSKKERKAGKQPDMTTASDLAKLSRALIKTHPDVFRYSAAKTRMFREHRLDVKPLPMGNHNALLRSFPGCDGLKTGWTNAGASIVTTASRGHRRVIAVVLGGIVSGAQKGSVDAKTSQRERNQRAAELMYEGLKKLDVLKYEPTPENGK